MIPMPTTWCMYYRGITPAPEELLDINIIADKYKRRPYFAYPMPGGQLRRFAGIREWYGYVTSLRIQPERVFLAYVDAFDEALRALFMTYALPEFSKFGEMKALATLEGALLAVYEHKMCRETKTGKHRCAGLGDILGWAKKHKGLPSEFFECDPARSSRSDLNVIRIKQMHGYLLEETLPWGGLFESVRRVIEFAYRECAPYDVHKDRLVYGNGLVEAANSSLDFVPVSPPSD